MEAVESGILKEQIKIRSTSAIATWAKSLALLGLVLCIFPIVLGSFLTEFVSDSGEFWLMFTGTNFMLLALVLNFRGFSNIFGGSKATVLGIVYWGLWIFFFISYGFSQDPNPLSAFTHYPVLHFYPEGNILAQESKHLIGISWSGKSELVISLAYPLLALLLLFSFIDMLLVLYARENRFLYANILSVAWSVVLFAVMMAHSSTSALEEMKPNVDPSIVQFILEWWRFPLIAAITLIFRCYWGLSRIESGRGLVHTDRHLVTTIFFWITWFSVLVICSIAYLIADKVNRAPLDMSSEDLYDLSSRTANWLTRLDNSDAFIVAVLADDEHIEKTIAQRSDQETLRHVRGYLKKYDSQSSKFHVDYVNFKVQIIDGIKHGFDQGDAGRLKIYMIDQQLLDSYQLRIEDIVNPHGAKIHSADITELLASAKSKKLTMEELTKTIPAADYQLSRSTRIDGYRIEQEITKTIRSMLGNVNYPVCIAEGFGSLEYQRDLTEIRNELGQDIAFKRVGLEGKIGASGKLEISEIPGSCDTLIFPGPTEDLQPEAQRVIRNYLDKGGNLLLTLDAPVRTQFKTTSSGGLSPVTVVQPKLSNALELVKDWGIEASGKFVLSCPEECLDPKLSPYKNLLTSRSKYTRGLDLAESEKRVKLVIGRLSTSLRLAESPPEGISLTKIMNYDATCYEKSVPVDGADPLIDPRLLFVKDQDQRVGDLVFAASATRSAEIEVPTFAEDAEGHPTTATRKMIKEQHVVVVGDTDWLRNPFNRTQFSPEQLNDGGIAFLHGLVIATASNEDRDWKLPLMNELKRTWDPRGDSFDLESFRVFYYLLIPLILVLFALTFVFVRRRRGRILPMALSGVKKLFKI